MSCGNLQEPKKSRHTETIEDPKRHRSTKGFQATHLAKGSPGSLRSNDSLFNLLFSSAVSYEAAGNLVFSKNRSTEKFQAPFRQVGAWNFLVERRCWSFFGFA